jgi:transcriptional regulator with XRE-family HTH domain
MAARLTKNGKKVGRPNGTGKLRTPEHADYICEQLELGRTLRQIAQDLGFTQSQISQWGCGIGDQPRDDSFINRYARSLSARWEAMAEQVIEIAEEIPPVDAIGHVDTGWVQNQRLRIDTKKWLLSKALPKKYGERVEAMVTGDPNAPLLTRIELVAVPPRARIEDSTKTIEHDPEEPEE